MPRDDDDDDAAAPEVEPLTEEDRRALAERLDRELAELRAQLELLKSSSAPVSLDLSIGRLSRVDALQQQHMASATRGRVETQIRQIGVAIRRLQTAAFGECAACGADIGRRRLLARPWTPYCRHCEEEGR